MILQRFRFNLLFKTAGEFVARLSSFIFYAAAARLLGAREFGLFSLAFSYAFISLVLIDVGLNNILTREVARDKPKAGVLIPTVTGFKFLITPLGLIAVHILVRLLGYEDRLVHMVDLMGIVAVGTAFGEHISSILSGLEKMNVEAGLKGLWKGGSLVLAVAGFYLSRTTEGFIIGMGIGQWTGVIAGFAWLWRRVRPLSFSFEPAPLLSLLRASFPLFTAWIFFFLYDNQDIYILSGLSFSPADIGYFSASAKLIDALRPIPVLFMGALFPIISEASVQNPDLFRRIVRPVLMHSLMLMIPIVFVLSVWSGILCRLFFGEAFAGTGRVFGVAIWAFLGIYLNHLLLQILVSLDGQKEFFRSSVLAAAVNAVACWFLFRRLGIVGGAWALIVSELAFIGYTARHVLIKTGLGGGPMGKTMGKIIVAGGSSGLLFLLLKHSMPAGAAVFIVLSLYMGILQAFHLIDWSLLNRIRSVR